MKKLFTLAGESLFLSLYLGAFAPPMNAQVADTLSLPEIHVSANRFDIPDVKLSTMIQRYDVQSIPEAGFISAGDILKRNARFIVRTYGPGQAQTSGSIGFNASQVKVMWNGMELNHPMLGLVDLSLFPATLINEIAVDNNLGSSEYGSSSLGGTILMESGTIVESRTAVEMNIGSYNSQQYSIVNTGSSIRWNYSIGLVNLTQDNDFSLSGVDNLKRVNADKSQFTGVGSVKFTGTKYWGDVSVWFNTGETGSPGSLSFPSATARQKDRSTRFVHRSNWIHSSLFQSQFYASFNRIGLDYLEPAFDIRSVSDVDVFSVSYALRFKPGKSYQIRFRTGYDNTNIISTDFNLSNVNRYYVQTNGLFAISRRVNLYPSLRFDSYSEFDHAISYGFGANLDIIKDKLYVLANINKNYAPPTLNDMYWPGFGNPDLKPETAIKSDVGLRFLSRNLTYDLSLFSSSTDNGILWWPDSNGNYSPNNVNEITTRGISTAIESNFDIGVITTTLSSSLTWLNAQYRQRNQDGSFEGNRVVYSPAFRSGNEVRFQTKSVGVSMNHHYTSSRPVNDANSLILPSVNLFDATAFYATKISNFNLRIAISVQNMTNESYQLIYGYPMPERSWNFSLRFSF